MSNNQPPFRMPCEAVAGRPLHFFGAPFQHALAPLLADKFVNNTAVENPDAGIGGTVPPYERWTPDLSGGLSCEVHHCATGPSAAPCSAWKVPLTANVFTNTGDFVDMAVSRKRGFKNVMARRYWNGRFGYTHRNGPDTWQPCGDATTRTSWRSVQSTVDRTKYLKIVADSSWHIVRTDNTSGAVLEDITRTASVTEEISSTTGVLNPTAMTLSPNELLGGEPDTSPNNEALVALQKAFWTWNDVVNLMTNFSAGGGGLVATYGASEATLTNSGNGQVWEHLIWDVSSGTFNRTLYNITTGFFDAIVTEQITISDTTFEYSYHQNLTSPSLYPDPAAPSTLDISVTGTLSVTNADATIYSDIKTLLNEWKLNDDKQYPWRTDLKVSLAPLVSRDEIPTFAFDAIGFYVNDYNSPRTDDGGFTIGDPNWVGTTGATLAPNPLTGTMRVSHDFPGYSSGTAVDIQIPGFAHTDAAITCTKIGGSFPSGVSMTSAGHITGTVGDDGHWGVTIEVTCGVPAYTGAILGSPKPAGYIDYFDFRYQHWAACCYHPPDSPELSAWSWYLQGWGKGVSAFNDASGCHLPLNATQWTNWFQSVNKPIGAFLFYNDLRQDYCGSGCPSDLCGSWDADALWGCKYAEILEQWPSQNFAMPSGDAKFWFDENQVYCATNISGAGAGSTWNLIDVRTGAMPSDGTIDLTKIWGGPVVGGFYNITSYSAGMVTLGSKQWDLPSNWISKSHVAAVDPDTGDPIADEDSCFGMLRWPTQPALLGRIAVTTTGPGTTFTFASAQPAFGMDTATHQEQVDLFDASMTAVATNVTATRISDTQFSVVAGQPTAVWVQIHGAAKYYANDTSSKGDGSVLDWRADLRSTGEYNRLTGTLDCSGTQVTRPTTNVGGGPVTAPFAEFNQTQFCLPFQPCGPKVICISPNGETFPNGVTYDFPEDFVCDEEYGSKWWKKVESTMTDLFWQKPHRPCNIETCAKWVMDNGLCLDDLPGICPATEEAGAPEYFFATAPQVEARLTVPNNYGLAQNESAPSLPSGVQIGWLSPVNYDAGEVAFPPEPPGVSDPGTPNGAATAWTLHATICDHSAGCRFGYKLPGC